ncbi:unnamed protein product [Mytilus coruscus]|uniref:Tyr recombinase domain-containing protein n=1 Tax=Mytilus coruscus TaxID=42192 RepID=A0A6J8BGM6_MYTCO|nr:unnamed protein product [Mytilus coruscus]
MMCGTKRLSAAPDLRRPITLSVLHDIIRALPFVCRSFYQQKLFSLMFLMAFHAFLRIGEITIRNKQENHNLIYLENLTLKNFDSGNPYLVLEMSNFKHNLSKQPVQLQILSQVEPDFCPVKKMREFLELRGKAAGPLFCYRDTRPIQRSEFCNILTLALSSAKYDTKFYKSHSFLIGAATTAHMIGIPDSKIRTMGRWHSDSYNRYIRVPLLPCLPMV